MRRKFCQQIESSLYDCFGFCDSSYILIWYFLRTKMQQCGFTGIVQELRKPFPQARTTTIKDKISNQVGLGKGSSNPRTTGPQDTPISTILRRESPSIISNKTLETGRSLGLKDSLSSPKCGQTATNQFLDGL